MPVVLGPCACAHCTCMPFAIHQQMLQLRQTMVMFSLVGPSMGVALVFGVAEACDLPHVAGCIGAGWAELVHARQGPMDVIDGMCWQVCCRGCHVAACKISRCGVCSAYCCANRIGAEVKKSAAAWISASGVPLPCLQSDDDCVHKSLTSEQRWT